MSHRVWKQNLYAAPGIGLSLLPKIACCLACLRRSALVDRPGIPDPESSVFAAFDCDFPSRSCRDTRRGCTQEARLRAAGCRNHGGWLNSGRQIFIGIQSDLLRRTGTAGPGFGLE